MVDYVDAHWRYTQKPARFFALDARSAIALLLVLLHIRAWTLGVAVFVMALFWLLERRGLSLGASLRAARCWVLGERRPANHRRVKRYWIDYDYTNEGPKR